MLDPAKIAPEKFVLVVGNARSGTTIVGSIVDSHPRMVCANETSASARFWRGLSGRQIIDEIVANSAENLASGKCGYGIPTEKKDAKDIVVVGDKVWNPALLLMAGRITLLDTLSEAVGCAVHLVHCVRNPFDAIATMHRRSGASLRDRFHWYSMHCEAIQAIVERDTVPIKLIRNEDLIAEPVATARSLFDWLGYPAEDSHLTRIEDRIFQAPSDTRLSVEWSPDLVRDVSGLLERFPFLTGYEAS